MKYHKNRGLTLMETLGLVTIVSAIALIAIPSFMRHSGTHDLRNHTTALHELVKTARRSAVSSHKPVVLCGTNDHQHCTHGAFNGGMMAFIDHNMNAKFDPEDQAIGGIAGSPNGLNIAYKGFPYQNVHVFSTNKNLTSNGSFLVSHQDAEQAYKLAISKTGQSALRYY